MELFLNSHDEIYAKKGTGAKIQRRISRLLRPHSSAEAIANSIPKTLSPRLYTKMDNSCDEDGKVSDGDIATYIADEDLADITEKCTKMRNWRRLQSTDG
ncbi:MAG: hypothetical protein R2744_00160 [Bacteroidales bacterium]